MLKIFCFIAVILLSGCAGFGVGASGGSEGVSVGVGTGISLPLSDFHPAQPREL